LKLMQMQGDINRQETRACIFWGLLAPVLAIIALVLALS